ncbi:MAG TPA: potassium channel family protein [Candidatus Nanopelagicales bacterium]
MAMGPSPAAPLVDAALADHLPRRLLALAAARSLGVVAVTLLVYALVPIRPETAPLVGVMAVLGLVLVGVVFARQMGRISRADRPVLAAIEALALVFGMFLTLFAFIYVSLSANDPGSFTQPVDKVAGVYFSVTVLATVGFGDIAAVTDAARMLVTLQMVLDLVLIGVAVKLLSMSARRAVQAKLAKAELPGGASPTSDSGG